MINLIKLYRWKKSIEKSKLFDKNYYLFTYPDVREKDIDPIIHYLKYGAFEGKNPSAYFNTRYYLEIYPNVKASGINPLMHFIRYGLLDGRSSKKNEYIKDKTLLFTYVNNYREKLIPKSKKRLLIFAHYNKQNLLSDHVLYTLNEMNGIYSKIIFVSNSQINEDNVKKLKSYCDKVLVRKNIGFDFGAWKEAILDEGFVSITDFDSLTLMNDTCFGPLQNMTSIYEGMESEELDFWGLTNHRASSKGMPGTNGPIPEHLQSYFLVFNKNVCQSNVFSGFWQNITTYIDRNLLIQNCETALTPMLHEEGFKYKAFIDCRSDTFNEDIAMNYPELLLERGMPFLKVRRFKSHEEPKYLLKLIKSSTSYPIKNITDFFYNTESPNFNLKFNNNILYVNNSGQTLNSKVVVHVHAFYPDILSGIILKLKNTDFDIIITTCSEDKRKSIHKIIKNYNIAYKVKDIVIVENIGRDIYPWLKIHDVLNEYEIVLHIHTKKSPSVRGWIGEQWTEDNLNNLVTYSSQIISYFEGNPNLGIVIPEVPTYFKFRESLWGGNEEICQFLWDRLKCKKKINFKLEKNPIFPIGFMFWYRTKALKPLMKTLIYSFPNEPIPNNKTILHAIERLPVYIAWSEGYEYRIAITDDSISSGFDYKISNLN